MKQLLAFRGLAHDPQSVLAAVQRLALVGCERLCNFYQRGISGDIARLELGVTAFADAKDKWLAFYDPQFALGHVQSLAHPLGRA